MRGIALCREATIDHVAECVRQAREQRTQCWVLIGAGCSVSAGIPTAAGIVREVSVRYPSYYAGAASASYADVMASLPIGPRQKLIRDYVDKAKVNWAHLALAELVRAGYIARVLTPNFDNLVSRACALAGFCPAVYDLAGAGAIDHAMVASPAVLCLHGQHSGFLILNTKPETRAQLRRLKPLFEDSPGHRLWIVVGYGGDSDPLLNLLADVRAFREGFFWVAHRDEPPCAQVHERLLSRSDVSLVRGHDADAFFCELARRAMCFPPAIVWQPFAHLFRLLGQIEGYPPQPNAAAFDPLERARSLVNDASQSVGLHDQEQLTRLLMANAPREAVALVRDYGDSLPDTLRDLATWSYVMLGNEQSEAAAHGGGAAEALFRAACDNYNAALGVSPGSPEALSNQYATLLDWASTKSGTAADELVARAQKLKADAWRHYESDFPQLGDTRDRTAERAGHFVVAAVEATITRRPVTASGDRAFDVAVAIADRPRVARDRQLRKHLEVHALACHRRELNRLLDGFSDSFTGLVRWSAGGATLVLRCTDGTFVAVGHRGEDAPIHQWHLCAASGLSHSEAEWLDPSLAMVRECAEELLIMLGRDLLLPRIEPHGGTDAAAAARLTGLAQAEALRRAALWHQRDGGMHAMPAGHDAPARLHRLPQTSRVTVSRGASSQTVEGLVVIDSDYAAIDLMGALEVETGASAADLLLLCGETRADGHLTDDYVFVFAADEFAKLFLEGEEATACCHYRSGRKLGSYRMPELPCLNPPLLYSGRYVVEHVLRPWLRDTRLGDRVREAPDLPNSGRSPVEAPRNS